ncbi:MAG TPA: hypothetical protein VFQ05_04645, partial [Candidatus Eisenbacteria bacterium]|nr:hypothetical protein [Candidatus Eisenbacteria bacterium]
GRPEARTRADQRLSELRMNLGRNAARQDSMRAARQLQPLGRPLADFAGTYREPSYGTITFALEDGRLAYRWGAIYGSAENYDATQGQMRIEVAGSGQVVTFQFAGAGPAQSIELAGVTFRRVP